MKNRSIVFAMALAFASTAVAGACDGPEYRQFDFWVGEWIVTVPGGKRAGVNHIAREYRGCVVHERYTSVRGFAGESLNTWDSARNVWHQSWVDNAGTLLLLEGGLKDGAMVLEGEGVDDAGSVRHRVTWTPNADGSVRQHWETSGLDGVWKTTFDGLYRRRNPASGEKHLRGNH